MKKASLALSILIITLLITCLFASAADYSVVPGDSAAESHSLDKDVGAGTVPALFNRTDLYRNDRALFAQTFDVAPVPMRVAWISIPVASLMMLLAICFSDRARMKG